jgi:hypothetical protein
MPDKPLYQLTFEEFCAEAPSRYRVLRREMGPQKKQQFAIEYYSGTEWKPHVALQGKAPVWLKYGTANEARAEIENLLRRDYRQILEQTPWTIVD